MCYTRNTRFVLSATARTGLDLDVNTSGQAQFVQCINRLVRGQHNVNQALVRTNLELFPRLLVDVRATQHRVSLNTRRERDRPVNLGFRTSSGLHDLFGGLIQNRVIVGFHSNSDAVVAHIPVTRDAPLFQSVPTTHQVIRFAYRLNLDCDDFQNRFFVRSVE